MRPDAANNLLDEVDPTGRLNDVQKALLRDLVKEIDIGTAMRAVRGVYLERTHFDIPNFRQALDAISRGQTSGPIQWHLDACRICRGTGWEYTTPLDSNGITYEQVIRCTNGPRITRHQWAEWEATAR